MYGTLPVAATRAAGSAVLDAVGRADDPDRDHDGEAALFAQEVAR
jgi:hypothetical protein